MAEERKALIAFHYPMFGIASYFEDLGYTAVEVYNLEDMLEKMGIPRNGDWAEPTIHYDWYIMDTNLGEPNGLTCWSAEKVYGLVKKEVEEGRVRFMSFTGNDDAMRLAKEKGIPVISKSDPHASSEFYNQIKSY